MNVIHDIKSYTVKSTDIFFFDNNIWIYLLCPLGGHAVGKQKIYSQFLKEILLRKAHIHITSILLSEFCNTWLRLEFNLLKSSGKIAADWDYKKNFVSSPEFKKAVLDVKAQLVNMSKIVTQNGDDFASMNLAEEVLPNFGEIDFNDSYFQALARSHRKNWKIVTNDTDYLKQSLTGCEIITVIKA